MSQVFNKVGAAVGVAALLLSAGASAAGGAATNVVVQEVREGAASNPAHRLIDARVRKESGGTRIDLVADGGVGTYELMELANPPRLALDLHGVEKAPRAGKEFDGAIRGVRYGQHDGKVRVVIDAAPGAAMPKYTIDRTESGLSVLFEGAEATASAKPAPKASRTVVRIRWRGAGADSGGRALAARRL